MGIRLDFFYVILAIHYLFDHDEAASNDQDGKLSKKKKKRWTPQDEADLMFVDVLTDTGEPNHFARIKSMWHKEYPNSNVTNSALYKKIHNLRKESLEEGELKKNFKWNEELEQELLDVYHNVSSLKGNTSVKLEEEWKRRHPDYRGAGNYLFIRARMKMRRNKHPEYRSQDPSTSSSHDTNEESRRRTRHTWTKEWNDKLRSIDKLTDTGKPYQFERIKSKWFEEYPDSNMTEGALRSQLSKLRRESQEEGGRKGNVRWDEESERELLDIYLDTYPYRQNINITLEAEWNSRHQGLTMPRKYLMDRARKLMKENKYPEYRARVLSTTDFQWDDYHDSELMHIRKIAGPERGLGIMKTHRIWSALHPEYLHVTSEQLKERLNHLKRYPPNEDFPFTKEENQELLEIYDETMPEREDQGQRIYDIWSGRHPRYSFMTPYYLQVHASTLARKREVEGVSKYKRSNWTEEEKHDLVHLVHQYSRERLDDLRAFHEEWVRKHPRLAYKTNTDLMHVAKHFEFGGIAAPSIETGEGSQSRSLELKHRKRNKYTPRMKQELLDMFHQTFPRDRGHARRLKQKWDEGHGDLAPIKGSSLRINVQNWEERGPDKRADKAPIVYSSVEAGSPSAPGISGDSE